MLGTMSEIRYRVSEKRLYKDIYFLHNDSKRCVRGQCEYGESSRQKREVLR